MTRDEYRKKLGLANSCRIKITPEERKRHRDRIKGYREKRLANRTPAETAFVGFLKKRRIRFTPEKIMKVGYGKHRLIDFYLPDFNIGVEIDGGYHLTAEQFLKDYERTQRLKLKVGKYIDEIRFTNDEVLNGNPEELEKRIVFTVFPFAEKWL